jgi:hypothetical protein
MEPVTDTEESPAEVEIIKKASGAPFKPPSGKLPPLPPPNAPFPPPPSAKPAGKVADKAYTKKVKKIALIAGGVLGLLVVTGGGFFAFQMFTKEEPPPPPRKAAPPAPKPEDQSAQSADAKPADAATTPATDKPVDAAAQPTATTDQAAAPQTALGQAVATTKDTITQVEQGRTAAANEVIASDSPAPKTDETKPAAATPDQKPAVAETKPVTPAPRPAGQAPAPSAAFKAWVAELKVGGVRGGANPRLFVGGITYPQGEVVNPQLGIIFDSYDEARKVIVFRDRSGAKVERRR